MFKTESLTIPYKHKLKIEIGDRKTSIKFLYIWKTTWVTLGKLPWKSKIPIQGNGMAAIPKKSKVCNIGGVQYVQKLRSTDIS